MRSSTPHLLPLLRSRAQGDILACVFLAPERRHSVSELSDHARTSLQQTLREVRRLEDAGLVRTQKAGNTRYVEVRDDNPLVKPLTELLTLSFGPIPVLTELLDEINGVESAIIYGSWAARYLQVPGPVPGDIDVLLLGDTDMDQVRDMAKEASHRLAREVSVRRMTMVSWKIDANTGFRETLRDRPRVVLRGADIDEL
ncbi:MAG: winged helix-turn-helix domain-containing protein [Aeromicrobium sp.]|uniref:winged helix-turn-helix domain-containing protein n=1 Tax=Aeromicrobium sp. TaxID=1871063 RepID=UPI0039E23A76